MGNIPAELVVPGIIFLGYFLVILVGARVFTGEWISIPAAFITVFLAGFLQIVLSFGMETAGVPSLPLWVEGGILEFGAWLATIKVFVKSTLYRALCIALTVEALTWIFRAFGYEWSLGAVMRGWGKLLASLF